MFICIHRSLQTTVMFGILGNWNFDKVGNFIIILGLVTKAIYMYLIQTLKGGSHGQIWF